MTNAEQMILTGQLAIMFALRDLILDACGKTISLEERAENLSEVAEAIREAIRHDL